MKSVHKKISLHRFYYSNRFDSAERLVIGLVDEVERKTHQDAVQGAI